MILVMYFVDGPTTLQSFETNGTEDDILFFNENNIGVAPRVCSRTSIMPVTKKEATLCLLRCEWKKVTRLMYEKEKIDRWIVKGQVYND